MMGRLPRVITPTSRACGPCGTALVTTRDAIGRPRDRCPQCQSVNRHPEDAGTVTRGPIAEAADPPGPARSNTPRASSRKPRTTAPRTRAAAHPTRRTQR